MPYKCPVCDNEEYDEIDGHFVCTECQTQSQEMIVEETEPDYTAGRFDVMLPSEDTASTKKKPKVSFGRPWTIYEAYQIIVMAQAESLIKQGASEALKDTVFTIWANYLARLGVAFCSHPKLVPDIVTKTKYGRLRELHRGTLNNPKNKKRRRFAENLTVDEETGATHVREEQLLEDDADHDIIFLNDAVNVKKKSKENLSLQSRKKRAYNSPEWMNMNKTLAINYIGLMFTNPNTLPFDVVRFVYESKVPFLSVTHLLLPDMVLSGKDKLLFETSKLDSKVLIAEVNQLLTYLNLDRMPTASLDVLIPRFIKELSLPGELASITLRIKEKIPFKWQFLKLRHYKKEEVVAMGYIVLAVKLALGLDDSTELRLSKYSKKLQHLVGAGMRPFVWTDWVQFITQKRMNTFDAYKELTKDISRHKVQYVHKILESYYKTESDKRKNATYVFLNRHQHFAQSRQPEFRASLRKPLEVASERMERGTNKTSNAEFGETRGGQELWTTESQQFEKSTISHIVDISSFKNYVGQLASDTQTKLDELLLKYSFPRTDIVQYNVLKDVESLESQRHESYLCLLSLVSETIDCSLLELDTIIVHLLNYLGTVSNGTTKEGQVCSQVGLFCPSNYRQKKALKRKLLKASLETQMDS